MSEAKSTKEIDWNDPSVIRYHALKMKPKTVAQARRNMVKYLKNQGNYKISDFKGMSYNEIRPIFEKVWDFNQHIEPVDLEHGSEKMKSPEKIEEEDVDTQKEMKEVSKESGAKRKKSLPRKSTRSTVKRQKMEEDAEKEDLKGYLDIVPREDVVEDVESLFYKYLMLSRYTSNPSTQHWQAVQRVLKYLKKTMDYSLTYTSYPSVLEGYTDASWISNTEDNSSTSDWVFLLGGGVIFWASKKQTCITSSTTEYEFVASAASGKEAKWLRNLIFKISLWSKPITPISIYCNSATTLVKAYSQMYNGKSRHLGIRVAKDVVLKSAEVMGLKSN
ncbi:hypothetical protein Tco_0569138 [Tanacetum coccineum]